MEMSKKSVLGGFIIPILLAGIIIATYYLTRQNPALAGGFYIAVGESILETLPAVADSVPHYTSDGVRLGMPPFAATIAAGMSYFVGPVTTAFFLPILYYLSAVIAGSYLGWVYLQATDYEQSIFAGLIGSVLASSPAAFFWHITAGGTVRALGYVLFLLTAAITIQIFRDDVQNRIAVLGVLVGLTISTHPFYGLYACLTVFVGWLAFDLTSEGLRHGFVIGFIAAIPVAIWMIPFVLEHGLNMYLTLSGTRGGIVHFTWEPLTRLFNQSFRSGSRPLWVYFGFGGIVYAVIQGRRFLLGLTAVSLYIIPRPRFMIVPMLLLSGVFIFSIVSVLARTADLAELSIDSVRYRRIATATLTLVLVISTLYAGVTYLQTDGGFPHSFVDDSDQDVAQWVSESTDPSTTYIITDDFREWFPVLADRTSLVAPRGAEWDPPGIRGRELREREAIHDCNTATCLRKIAKSQPKPTDYLIVPTNRVVYGTTVSPQSEALLDSLHRSENFTEVYRNRGNIIFRIAEGV